MNDHPEPAIGAGLERISTLVDAVVAIAMTLLILPLVDVAGDAQSTDLINILAHGLLPTFVISFVVIYAYWDAHTSIYGRLRQVQREQPRGLSTVNLVWLLAIAFVPFPTAMIGRDLTTTTAPIYLATLLLLSLSTLTLMVLVHRAAELPLGLLWLTPTVLGAALLISFINPLVAMYLLLLLIVARPLENRSFKQAVAQGTL